MKNPEDPEGANPERANPERPAKRPYRKPRLDVYGELGQLTGALGKKSGNSDSGTGKTTSTF